MTKLIAELRDKLARPDEVSPLEYALVAAFVLLALLAVIPGLAPALADSFSRLLPHLA
jgi:Flp pilus assembly pilin Flp